MRWTEMAAFTPVMRTHEGNRPRDNLQIDEDEAVLAHFAAMTRVLRNWHLIAAPLADEAVATGLPMQRPLFLHFADDPACYQTQTAYLLGEDLLVAPIVTADTFEATTYLPAGTVWVHFWSGTRHEGGGSVTSAAPHGQPPVFYRENSAHAGLFERLPGRRKA